MIETNNEAEKLVDTITKGIQDKKGSDIAIVDLNCIDGAVANYFVICQGSSPAQIEAITESIGIMVKKDLNEKPINVIGLGNSQWVAMDYANVLVHVFTPETREFYDLENLWEDAKITKIPNLD